MGWAAWATLAAVAWGVSYALAEELLRLAPARSLAVIETALAFVAFVVLLASGAGAGGGVAGALLADLGRLLDGGRATGLLAIAGFSFGTAYLVSLQAIRESNAVLSTLLEVSYPLFTALAAALLFGEDPLSLELVIAGGLIGVGVVVVAGDDPG